MVVVAVPGLLTTATLDLDRFGAAALVFFAGGGLLLAARSYRHALARSLLRIAGLYAWVALVVTRLLDAARRAPSGTSWARRWRSPRRCSWRRWRPAAAGARSGGRAVPRSPSRCAAAFAVAALVVAAGLFRHLWELTSLIRS